jgi:type I restriction enzyme M protein
MNNFNDKANFIWSIAELLRDRFKRGKYQDVILPFTVLRRIDCVLAPTKEKVLETHTRLKGKLENLEPQLRKASRFAFYNTSKYDFDKLLDDAPNLAANLRAYINSFSENMRQVLEMFDFPNTIAKLDEYGLLFLVMERFASKDIDLHPDKVSNHEMGYIFEELVRRFNEALDENPGEHFTPREVIRLMVLLVIMVDLGILTQKQIIRTVCDPCNGSGGMLTISKEQIHEINPNADVHLFGHESQPETFALCKADLYMVSADGRDADNIKYGSTLSNWQLGNRRYDYQFANPPYGKEWKMDEAAVKAEAARGYAGRFGAGLPRISDGQLLFLQHMLSRMKEPKEGGGRVAIVMNGSPLFTGDAGSGESEIRRWILENDWLEAIIALPDQLFYNTGISTYVWVLSNRKEPRRKGKVQLIDASSLWVPMRKSLGNKRHEISPEQIQQIVKAYLHFQPVSDKTVAQVSKPAVSRVSKPADATTGRGAKQFGRPADLEVGDTAGLETCATKACAGQSKILKATDFGYRKITIERPLRLNFQASGERIERLKRESGFMNLAVSKKKEAKAKAAEEAEGHKQQDAILAALRTLPDTLYKSRPPFEEALDTTLKKVGLKVAAPIRKAILSALSERDETAEICRDADGNPEPDPELRDTENVPLLEDINAYFEREVKPHVPDAWVNTGIRDDKDGEVGKVGYEINFNRYFYQYQPPRPLPEIEADIRTLENEIAAMLREVAG